MSSYLCYVGSVGKNEPKDLTKSLDKFHATQHNNITRDQKSCRSQFDTNVQNDKIYILDISVLYLNVFQWEGDVINHSVKAVRSLPCFDL